MKNTAILLLAAVLVTACESCKPVIGISGGCPEGSVSVRDEYSNAIFKAGGIPMVLPATSDSTLAEEFIRHIDGLILTGGEDIQPAYYGEDVLNETVECNHRRDTSDFILLKAALRHKLPLLAICRGEQLVNVMLGGSLYQDLPSQTDTIIHHRQDKARNTAQHTIRLESGSRLRELLGVDSIGVNSFHHQAVKVLAEGMKINAKASDGIIEGFEGEDILCVQFHPEAFVSAGDETFLPIFTDLVERASR